MKLHSGLPYWITKNPLCNYYNPIDRDITVDIAIIGAGITGALAAHQLCCAGMECCVIEKRSIATGSTAASTALLQYEVDVPLSKLSDKIGEENAVLAYRECLESISSIKDILRQTNVDAEFRNVPSIYRASNMRGHSLIKKEYEIRKKHHLPTEYLDRKALKDRYHIHSPGALRNEAAAQMDPNEAAAGILRHHFEKSGLAIYTYTKIISSIETDTECILQTDDGKQIKCKYAIIAAGFEADKFLPQSVMQLTSTYAIASQPIRPDQFWPERSLIWETADPYLYIRTTAQNRIILGGEDDNFNDPVKREKRLTKKSETLKRKFKKIFPDIPFVTEMEWCGTFSTTDDGLPFIGPWPGKPRTLYLLGYGGNGITFSMIGSEIIKNIISGTPDHRQPIFGFERKLNH